MLMLQKTDIRGQTPTLIGNVKGIRFYEHPIYGDSLPLIIEKNDEWYLTEFWELPEPDDLD